MSKRRAGGGLTPPIRSFTSPGGRRFSLKTGEHRERYPGDTLWSDYWPIYYGKEQAGKLFRDTNYGRGLSGGPRFHATIRELYWKHAADAPTGIGFDVSAFDTAKDALAAWSRSADQILDWEAGKTVPSIYAKSGTFKRVRR